MCVENILFPCSNGKMQPTLFAELLICVHMGVEMKVSEKELSISPVKMGKQNYGAIQAVEKASLWKNCGWISALKRTWEKKQRSHIESLLLPIFTPSLQHVQVCEPQPIQACFGGNVCCWEGVTSWWSSWEGCGAQNPAPGSDAFQNDSSPTAPACWGGSPRAGERHGGTWGEVLPGG